jgi:hypothetical protein
MCTATELMKLIDSKLMIFSIELISYRAMCTTRRHGDEARKLMNNYEASS